MSRWVSKPCRYLYLIDTRNGNQQIISKHANTQYYSKQWLEIVRETDSIEWFGERNQGDKYVVMSYAKFGALVEKDSRFGFDFEIIICDEIHSLPKFRSYSNGGMNVHGRAQEQLRKIVNAQRVKVIALTATPGSIEERMHCPIRHITVDDDVRRLDTKDRIPYSNKFQLLELLPKGSKGIVFIQQVKTMKEYMARATEKGFAPVCIWSGGNTETPMTDEQRAARDYILANEELPPQYDMVIINASCETGINIYGDVEYIVVHTTNEDTITQVRGRYRKDLNTLYYHDNGALIVPEEYLGIYLDKQSRDTMCKAIGIRDDKGRVYGWTTVRQRLEQEGYTITEKRINNARCYRITL